MKIVIISPKNKTLYNFRGGLIKKLVSLGSDVICIGPNKDNLDKVLELGVDFYEIPLKKDSINFLFDFSYINKLRKLFKKINPDIIIAYTIKPIIYSSFASRGLKNISKNFMITGLGRIYSGESFKKKFLRRIVNILYKQALKSAKCVFFQNSYDKLLFIEKKIVKESQTIMINGSGVDLERFKKHPIPENNYFVMVSRLIKEKGVIEYCLAASKIKKKYPQSKFFLVGGFDRSFGSLAMNDIDEYIDKNIIDYVGEVEDVIPYLIISRVFVLPSYYREGLPRSILEALAIQRPIITTDWPGCNEVFKFADVGWKVKPKSPNDLANAMEESIVNIDMLNQKYFNIDKIIDLFNQDSVNKVIIDSIFSER